MLMACSPLNCVQVSPNASTYGMSSHIVNEHGWISYAWTHLRLPGWRQGTPPCALEVFGFSSREFFGVKHSLFISLPLFVYGRTRLTRKSVMPLSVPVSFYGYHGLLWSSLGKEMARADIATSFLLMVSNRWPGVTDRPWHFVHEWKRVLSLPE
jgi:hypothetical protein